MNLTASFAEDAVGFFTAAVCVLDPKAARRRLDDDANRRINQVRPDHGWVGEKRADGTIYYTLRTLDAHGFERGEGSRHPPAGIDVTSIPVVDQGPGFPLEKWLAQTRALVMAFEPGQVFQLGRLGLCTAAVSLGAERHGLLHRLDALDAIIREGFARELRDRWLDAVQDDGVATLGADIEQAAAGFVVDAAVAGMARLMQAALLAAGPQSLPAQMLTRAFASHVSAFGIDDPQDQLAIEIMHPTCQASFAACLQRPMWARWHDASSTTSSE